MKNKKYKNKETKNNKKVLHLKISTTKRINEKENKNCIF